MSQQSRAGVVSPCSKSSSVATTVRNPQAKRKQHEVATVTPDHKKPQSKALRSSAPKAKRQLFAEPEHAKWIVLKGDALNYVEKYLWKDNNKASGNMKILSVLDSFSGSITRVELNDRIVANGGKPIVQARERGLPPCWVNCSMDKLEKYGFVERDKSWKETNQNRDGFLITPAGREALTIAEERLNGRSAPMVCHGEGQTSIMEYFKKAKKGG